MVNDDLINNLFKILIPGLTTSDDCVVTMCAVVLCSFGAMRAGTLQGGGGA